MWRENERRIETKVTEEHEKGVKSYRLKGRREKKMKVKVRQRRTNETS